jgi:Delta7-sterol 5-desaturase
MTVFEEKLNRLIKDVVGVSIGEGFWYLMMAGGTWLFFYVVFRTALRHRRVAKLDPTRRQVFREILHSLRSIAIFSLIWGCTVLFARTFSIHLFRGRDFGSVWFFLSIAVLVFLHDAYFYWTHRWMHHRRLFHFFHHTHHISISPTPWAAYAFSPAEAVVQAGIAPLTIFCLPLHPGAFGIFMLWQITFNVFGHCGYEIYPSWFVRSPLGGFLNTVTHHSMHHEKFKANFGLYFNLWDRLMGTNHPDYERQFELVSGKSQ